MNKRGIPTGGSICVQLANICVFYIMQNVIYSDPDLMKDIISVKRYIYDGAGASIGSKEEFFSWLVKANVMLAPYNLTIDEYSFEVTGNFVSCLDIKYCFDQHGALQTDLHVKETDSRGYLNYGSCHPNHIYSGIVFSQCLRLRRIINCEDRLKIRLSELLDCFRKCKYPQNMVKNITKKIESMDRDIYNSKKKKEKDDKIRVVSTYGCDNDIAVEEDLLKTKSFKSSNPGTKNVQKQKLFSFVKKTGPTLRQKLVKVKQLAVGQKFGKFRHCGQKKCSCCKFGSTKTNFSVNNKPFKTAPGSCRSYNLVYMLRCKCCRKVYIGRTIQELRDRMNQHRQKFYAILSGKAVVTDNDDADDFSPGLHLVEHGYKNRSDFNENYELYIIANCSPTVLDVFEHKFIHHFNTLRPNGINTCNPFRIPPL